MSQHTPGPWVLSITTTDSISIRPSIPEFAGPDAPDGWSICAIYGPDKVLVEEDESWEAKPKRHEFTDKGRAVFERNKANARLIAVAPEMLSALEKWRSEYIENLSRAEWLENYSDIEFIIAKARGERPGQGNEYSILFGGGK